MCDKRVQQQQSQSAWYNVWLRLIVCLFVRSITQQEGWLSPTERASVSAISLGTLFGYLRRVAPVCRCLQPFCGCRHLATSRESKAHFGLLYAYAPGNIAVNVTWIEREFSAGQRHSSIYPSIFQPFTSYNEILVGNCNFFLPTCI